MKNTPVALNTRIRYPHHFKLTKADMETPRGVTMTVADEAYTIKELLEKFTRGIDPSLSKLVLDVGDDSDFDDEDYSKLRDLDLSDQQDLLERTVARSEDLNKSLEAIKASQRPQKNKTVEDHGEDVEEQEDEPKTKRAKKSVD